MTSENSDYILLTNIFTCIHVPLVFKADLSL